MTIARAAMLAALVAAVATPSWRPMQAAPLLQIVTQQPAPKEPDARRPTVCTEQYAPVCGRVNNVIKTYSNACYARADGAEVIAQGPCK
jgi:Kazal-type serine protease inhibitor-like protein